MLREKEKQVKVRQLGVELPAPAHRVSQILHRLHRVQPVLHREFVAPRPFVVQNLNRHQPPVVVNLGHVLAHLVRHDHLLRQPGVTRVLARLVVEPPVVVQLDALVGNLKGLEAHLRRPFVLVFQHHHNRRDKLIAVLGLIFRHRAHFKRTQRVVRAFLRGGDVEHHAHFGHAERLSDGVGSSVFVGVFHQCKRILGAFLLGLVHAVHAHLAGLVARPVHPPEPHLVEP
mmetsp:Transcript_176/g.830  ORF Transcript_176/g.830 Transcript_176/m.830 type:complete len:229 (+) Transcript_176:278-964(+)